MRHARLLSLRPFQCDDKNYFSTSCDALGGRRRDRHPISFDVDSALLSGPSPSLIPRRIPGYHYRIVPFDLKAAATGGRGPEQGNSFSICGVGIYRRFAVVADE
jgi:hypothetical protein